jgi:hypothetical protein
MERLHSAYAWHDGGAYAWAEQPEDATAKEAVRRAFLRWVGLIVYHDFQEQEIAVTAGT